jgi:hypothetical protein
MRDLWFARSRRRGAETVSRTRAAGGGAPRRTGRTSVRAIVSAALMLGVLAALIGASVASAAKTSSKVGYVYDFGEGANDPISVQEDSCAEGYPHCGSSIFRNALTGTDPGATYTTADGTKTVTLTDVPVSTIDEKGVAALEPFDTLIVYEVCDIGEHPATMKAINTFLSDGGKVMLWDGDRCASNAAGKADYKEFLFPFTTSSPGPEGLSGSYTKIVPSTLTTGLSLGVQEVDTMGDANTFVTFSGGWCASITGTNGFGEEGFVQATATTPSGGLMIYEGEDNWFTDYANAHDRLVFDNMLEQNWDPDGLPCTHPASGIKLEPAKQTQPAGGSATVTATVENVAEEPVSGVTVTIAVTSGPDKGQSTTGTTNASGQTTFTYSDTGGHGIDSLVASFVDGEGKTHESPTAEVLWEEAATGPALDGIASAQHYNEATAKLSTKESDDLIVAFVAADSPYTEGQVSTVSGGGLTWTLVARENKALGGAEVWVARASGALSEAPITARITKTRPGSPTWHGYDETITVAAFKNSPGLGAVAKFSSKKGAATGTLTTTEANSWVWAVGDDWLASIPRTVPAGQTLWHQAFDSVGDTYWVQSTEGLTKEAGTPVTINDPAPTKDPFDLILVEVL